MIAEKKAVISQSSEAWFDELLAAISTHKYMLENSLADQELKDFYSTLMGNNVDTIAHQGKAYAQKHFVARVLVDYLSLLNKQNCIPEHLAFDVNDSELLVWAEINDDNEQLEKQLILAEAEINAKYHNYGYDITSMIVEKSDRLSIPNHYSPFSFQA